MEEHIEYTELITVFTTADLGTLAIAKSILDGENIKYSVVGDNFQSIFGIGLQGGIFGEKGTMAQIQVLPNDAETAAELLLDLSKS